MKAVIAVSNLGKRYGRTVAVVETQRPVELVNLYAAHDRTTRQLVVVPVAVDGEPNPFGPRLDPEPANPRGDRRDRARKRYATPRRVEVGSARSSAAASPAAAGDSGPIAQRITEKTTRIQSQVPIWAQKGGDPRRVQPLMDEFDKLPTTNLARVIGKEQLVRFASGLAALHRPLSIDWAARFGVENEQPAGLSGSRSGPKPTRRPWLVKFDGPCARCGRMLRAGSEAVWSSGARKMYCLDCATDGPG